MPVEDLNQLKSYLKFRTCVDGELSSLRPIESGVPQGRVLGSVMYLVCTNDLMLVPRVWLSLYADDAMKMCLST